MKRLFDRLTIYDQTQNVIAMGNSNGDMIFKDKKTNADINMSELKEMVDLIIDSGYKIRTIDFRETTGYSSGRTTSGRLHCLMEDLKDITIYKEDDIDITYNYIKGKYKSLKELLSIQDGSIFTKENNELFDYINRKTTEL